MSGQADLPARALRGTLWTYLAFASGQVLVFGSTLVLTRLLLPEQFGLMGYCLTAFQYLSILNVVGMDAALISRRDRVEEAANAAFRINIAVGLLLCALAWLASPALAAFFRAEALTGLFRLLALALPIAALGAVPDALIQRQMRFGARLVPDVGRSLVKGGLSIALAWQGFGAWSLVVGFVAGELCATAAFWALAGWRPTRALDPRVTREVLVFGNHIIAIGVIGALFSNADYLLVGRLLGPAALGYYTLAYRIPELVIDNTNVVVGRVAHPYFSRLQAEPERLRTLYRAYVRYLALFTLPAGVGLAVVAPPLLGLLYGPRWAAAIVPMQWLALALAISSIGFVPGTFYKAINRPAILNQLAIVKLPIVIAILWYSTRWGLVGVAVGQVAAAAFRVTLDVAVAGRVLRLRPLDTGRALAPAVAGALVMGAVALAVARELGRAGVAGALQLAALVAIGGVVYAAALAVVAREDLASARANVRAALARS